VAVAAGYEKRQQDDDWATVRLVPEGTRPLKDDDFLAFYGTSAHHAAEEYANRVILQRYGRRVQWHELDPWNYSCTMLGRVISGGPWIDDVYFIIG
jgi:hypothetical protein